MTISQRDSIPRTPSEQSDEQRKPPALSDDGASPPNGGLRAWLQVLASFFLFFNTWGVINTYGAYQTIYEETLLPNTTASTISWIGSIQSFLIMFLGVLSGPIYDAGHIHPLLYIGSFLIVVGHMTLSLSHTYWQILLAQSFCIGIGAGLLFVPSVAILSTYFTTKLPFVVGIAASGSSIGGVIYPIMLRTLQSEIGFGWSVRVTGFLALFGLSISCLSIKVRVLPSTKRKMVDLPAFRESPYTCFVLGMFLCFMGLYTPFYYIQSVAKDQNLVPANLIFYLLPIINAASTFGRLLPGYISQILGPFNILIPCALISGILVLCLLDVHSEPPLLVICILYGFFSGSLVSLSAPILVLLTPDKGMVGTRMGMCFMLLGVALLIGTPIAGEIQERGGVRGLWAYGGGFTIAGGVVLVVARWRWLRFGKG
ncbi:hypothetical protein ASPCADRAFT_162625 [Aspergillus carbonarius ITEM 5010]|uniref:Major facilitator superfamily (MFS) profile domain-containing protein n=1 Tax=Aspergillus carbonarius (strain ITEM 5010) TaxID=602072 RepID=A0A1R3RWM6_ASPC5|nr:hypothetical protein ASPCADRAFT_162625 [Aspergillus carbonarius ITEM 5010]